MRYCLEAFPHLELDVEMQPITRTILRIKLSVTPSFVWREAVHGQSMRWWIWVEDEAGERMLHSEVFTLTRKMHKEGTQHVNFTIPLFEPLPNQFFARCVSDSWLHAESFIELPLHGLTLPDKGSSHTTLLDLDPLPKSALKNEAFENMYSFSHFNPIQTQVPAPCPPQRIPGFRSLSLSLSLSSLLLSLSSNYCSLCSRCADFKLFLLPTCVCSCRPSMFSTTRTKAS